jgi:hypothetical protein
MNRVKVFLAVLISAGMGFPQAPKPAGATPMQRSYPVNKYNPRYSGSMSCVC